MRLRERDIAAIKGATTEVLGSDVTVRLFGSRVDDEQRGGDIDLHFVLPASADGDLTIPLLKALHRRMGERSIDVICYREGQPRRAIDEVALRDGIVL